jgi:hypothetical protein
MNHIETVNENADRFIEPDGVCRYVGRPRPGDYSGEIASVGQSSTQEPQSRHFSASMTYLLSPSEIASVGQLPTHEPHEIHSSLIT